MLTRTKIKQRLKVGTQIKIVANSITYYRTVTKRLKDGVWAKTTDPIHEGNTVFIPIPLRHKLVFLDDNSYNYINGDGKVIATYTIL